MRRMRRCAERVASALGKCKNLQARLGGLDLPVVARNRHGSTNNFRTYGRFRFQTTGAGEISNREPRRASSPSFSKILTHGLRSSRPRRRRMIMSEKLKNTTPEEYVRLPYARVLVPETEAGGFVASIREFPGCIAEGDTAEETLGRLNDAALSWVEAALHLGQPIPRPDSEKEFGGKVALRMSSSLHERVAKTAAIEGVSINQFIVTTVAERVGAAQSFSYTKDWLGVELNNLLEPICNSVGKSIRELASAYESGASAAVDRTIETFTSYIQDQVFYEPLTMESLHGYQVVHRVNGKLSLAASNRSIHIEQGSERRDRAA